MTKELDDLLKEQGKIYVEITIDVLREVKRATRSYKEFHNEHEGYAILLKEMDELWDAVKLNVERVPYKKEEMQKEAKQVAAMAIRFLHDINRSYYTNLAMDRIKREEKNEKIFNDK